MLFPSLETDISTDGIHMNPDANDCYVLKKCIGWLSRHIRRYPCFDTETLKIICWLLGSGIQDLGCWLLSQLNKRDRTRYVSEITQSALDSDDFAHELAKLLRESKSINIKRFFRQTILLMDQRLASLNDGGTSEIEQNIRALQKLFDLSDQEAELCSFFFVTDTYMQAERYFITHVECNKFSGKKYLANILGLSNKALHSIVYGKLARIGLFDIDRYGISTEIEFLNLIENPVDKNFARKFYASVPAGSVPLKNFLVKHEQTIHILNLLQTKAESPTHILLYGPPGTGKSSYAHSVLSQLDTSAFEIVRGEDNTTKLRRVSIIACLTATNNDQGSIILVDEADNLLNTKNSWLMNGETQDKGWLNQLLDQPGTRMIWITNRIDSIEDSVLRRFAYSLPFKTFNRSQRALLWDSILRKNKCKTYCNQTDIESLAKTFDVNAGTIDLATRKASETACSSKARFIDTIKMALQSYTVLINDGIDVAEKDGIEKRYSLVGLNVDGDLEAMMGQLEAFNMYLKNEVHGHSVNMNLLFYGPPGTGKSELGRHIADHLDRKIICKRISDLQSKYVGDGEKNVMRAFKEAETEEAVLIIDEADSILFSRDRARHSWEITFTNEFLTQMERYRGILVCTTNRLDDLDPASLRRFNHKTSFDYLTADGNLHFYDLFLKPLRTSKLNPAAVERLKKIKNLAPGDFKIVRNRYSFQPKSDISHQQLIDALEDEARLKVNLQNNKRIGF